MTAIEYKKIKIDLRLIYLKAQLTDRYMTEQYRNVVQKEIDLLNLEKERIIESEYNDSHF